MLKVVYSFATTKSLLVSCSAQRCVSSSSEYCQVFRAPWSIQCSMSTFRKKLYMMKQLSLNMIRDEEFSPALRFLIL